MMKKRFAAGMLCAAIVFGLQGPAVFAAGNTAISFDMNSVGKTIQNKFSVINVWDLNEWNAKISEKPSNFFAVNYPFVKTVQLMTATGGSVGRDLFVDPNDRTTLTDYKFDPLIAACETIVEQGLRPYIVTGNVPLKFSAAPVFSNKFHVNIRPPDADKYSPYYYYIKALGNTLVARFGKNEMRSWKWGVLTEYENKEWFLAADGTANSTKTAYFKLYDYTVAALRDSIGAENLTVGAHSMTCDEGFWDEREFIDHCAAGTNYIMGTQGTQLDFLTISYYDYMPGIYAGKRLTDSIAFLRNRAVQNGLTNLKYGVDEGRILRGPDDKQLSYCTVGHSYQGAADMKAFKKMIDFDIDWFSTWTLGSEGLWGGVNAVGTNVAALAHKMSGGSHIASVQTGAPQGAGNEVAAIGGYNSATNTAQFMVCHYNPDFLSKSKENVTVTINNIVPASGNTVQVRKWVVDASNANWWKTWWQDQTSFGLTDASYISTKSKFTAAIPYALDSQAAKDFWYSKQEEYKQLAALRSTVRDVAVSGNTITLHEEIDHHGVVLYEISQYIDTDDLNNWDKVHSRSPGLQFGTSSAQVLEDASRAVRSHTGAETAEAIVYNYKNISHFTITALFASGQEAIRDLKFYTSPDGGSWSERSVSFQDTLINYNTWTRRVYKGSAPSQAHYLKIAFPLGGTYSYTPQVGQVRIFYNPDTMVDPLNDWSKVYARTAGLSFGTSSAIQLGDDSRAVRTAAHSEAAEHIVYQLRGIKSFTATGLFVNGHQKNNDFKFYTSSDGVSWVQRPADAADTAIYDNAWIRRIYNRNLPGGCNYLKIEFPLGGVYSYNPQLGEVGLYYTSN